MATLVFDIETSGQPPDNFDDVQQEYLFREADKLPDPDARSARRAEIVDLFSLWPLTGEVVCVAMVNADSARGQVLFITEEHEPEQETTGDVRFITCPDEAELLTAFWEVSRHYDSIVTFNGRAFDIPYLYLRSAILNVPISRKDWLGYRFATEPHCDLADQLCFYGLGGRDGATRKFNLDFYCKTFGIRSPKGEGVTGHDVRRLFAEKRHREIAEYCLRDVNATLELYRLWRERLAGIK